LGKTNKKLKPNEPEIDGYATRSIKKRMNDFFKEVLPNDDS
jgi:hypothetical protein